MSPIIMEEKDIYRLKALRKVWETYEDIQNRMNHMFAYLVLALLSRIGPII